MATDFDWQGFRALTKRLDDLLGSERDDAEYAEELRRALAFVYTAGITMPTAGDIYEDSGGEAFADRKIDLDLGADPAEAEAAVATLAEHIARSVEAVQPEGDVDAEALEELCEVAAVGLLDVAGSLADGSAHYDDKRLGEASWEWSFQFDEWGANALTALAALHELLWGAR
jgi:hypothetical protein